MHDASLALNIHTTCARLMLNLVAILSLQESPRVYLHIHTQVIETFCIHGLVFVDSGGAHFSKGC